MSADRERHNVETNLQPREHPWELAWREGRWKEVTPPLPTVQDFAAELKLANARLVLDLGSGAGRHALYFAKMGFVVAALDVSETALKTLESHSKELDLHDMIIIKHDMLMLPFRDDYFDGMISTHVIHHGTMSEISKTINEIFRVIRKGGIGYIIALSENDFKLGQGNRLEQGTYVPTEGEERGIPHHLFTKEGLMNSMRAFEILSLKEDISQTEVGNRAHFHIRFRKPK